VNLNFDLDQINQLDFRETGGWPLPAKVVLCAVIVLVLVGAGYWFTVKDQLTELDSARQKETTLRQEFESKSAKAANLSAYKKQLADMQASFGALLRELPGQTEVDSLLRDISQTAQSDGLEQDLFQPKAEVKKDFYAEKPIEMRVRGNFHQLAHFVSDVAALPRIVTLHNISIKPAGRAGDAKAPDELAMTLTAKIYRYLEPDQRSKHKKRHGRR